MQDDHQQDYVEQTFATTMPYANFHKLVLRTCKSPHWVIIEGRDRSVVPHVTFATVRFSSIEDRDRVIISLRFVESGTAPAPRPGRKPALGETRLAVA
jgi:hypothetical protein